MKLTSHLPWRSLVVAATALVVAATPGAPGFLVLDRAAMLAGEIWRGVTGHLVHFSTYHLTWDVAGLVVLGALFERELGRRWWSLLGCSAMAVATGVLLFAPGLETYGGLSGVLNGLWVGGALRLAQVEGSKHQHGLRRLYLSCVVFAVCKIGFEAGAGAQIFTDSVELGGVPVPLAHAAGALAGVLWTIRDRARRRSEPSTSGRAVATSASI